MVQSDVKRPDTEEFIIQLASQILAIPASAMARTTAVPRPAVSRPRARQSDTELDLTRYQETGLRCSPTLARTARWRVAYQRRPRSRRGSIGRDRSAVRTAGQVGPLTPHRAPRYPSRPRRSTGRRSPRRSRNPRTVVGSSRCSRTVPVARASTRRVSDSPRRVRPVRSPSPYHASPRCPNLPELARGNDPRVLGASGDYFFMRLE